MRTLAPECSLPPPGDTPHRIALDRIEAAARGIDPVFLRSPQYECEPLSDVLGARLVLKVELANPVRSFKGRGADWLVSSLPPDRPLACASAGNFGQAMAYACRRRGLALTVFAAVTANPLKVERMRALGATVVLAGEDFDAAKSVARRQATEHGFHFVEDGRDPAITEGAGTIALELLTLERPLDVVLVPLGNGALFGGVARVIRAHWPSTRLVAVQAAGAPAMADSLRLGRVVRHDAIATIADGIGVREPIPEALADLRGLVDDVVLVRDESLLRAMRLLLRHTGLVVEPSGAAGIAAVLEQPDRVAARRTGTVLCGGNVAPAQLGAWLGVLDDNGDRAREGTCSA